MELMDESLTSFLERPADPPPLPLHVQMDIGHDVAQALSHLHHHEVLHRDLSSNNVLLIGSRRAKVTDFGMAKLLGSDPHLTPTYCPGTNAYMSPEALADPPAYTRKLDVFSCGVLFVQLITRKWPNPGPRTYTVQLSNDPRFPSGRALVEVPELERRKEHLDLISPTHPLLEVALDCLKDKEGQRLTAEQLCSCLIALKESAAYRDSLQQTPEEMTGQTPPARDQELEQQLRESESRVEDLTREVQQLQLVNEEQARSVQQLQHRNQELEAGSREGEQVMAALQQSVEQKDAVIREKEREIQTKDWLLQEKEREIQTKDWLLQEKEREIQTKDWLLQEKEREIQTKDESLQEKEREIQTKDWLLQEKEREIQTKDESLQEKEREIQTKDWLLQEKEREMQTKDELLQEKEKEIQTKDELLLVNEEQARSVQQKDGLIEQLQHRTRELEACSRESEQVVVALQQSVEQKDTVIHEKEKEIQTKDELLLVNEEKARSVQQKDGLIEQLQHRTRELKAGSRESEQVVAALQQSLEQKDAVISEKEREIQELQQRVRERERSGVATGPLKLKWRDGPSAPFKTFGHSVAVSGDMVYCYDTNRNTKVLMFNWRTGQWTVLPECPKVSFSIAVVNGTLTAIGGSTDSGKATNTLLSLPHTSQHQWIEQFPPMKYCRGAPAVTTTSTHLIAAGGWTDNTAVEKTSEVEVMETQTLKWSTVASLPHPVSGAIATICGDRLYLGGGFYGLWPTNSVVMCEVRDLLQSRPHSRATRLLSSSHSVWKKVASLPVFRSSLVTFQGQLLAVGGSTTQYSSDNTSEVRQYDATTNSWNVISRMRLKRCRILAAALPNNTLMVCGGLTPNGSATAAVEIASVL